MKKRLILLAALLLFVPAVCLTNAARAQEIRVTFFALDKADAILITAPDGERVLIDTGTNKDGKRLAERFGDEGIDALELMIVTHYDKDHVGGADKVLGALDVSRVIMPQYEKQSAQYEDFLKALKKSKGTQVESLPAKAETAITLACGATLLITAAHETDYGADEENDFSLCVRLAYGDTSFLFPGDAESARQLEILSEGDAACDVLKVPHHGKLHDASYVFLRAASPSIAYVPDGENEPASPVLLAMLGELGAEVYRTRDGELTVVSDGERVWTD